jgi:hypothetical protein
MKLGRLALTVAVVLLVSSTTASAHNSHGWFWGTRYAEKRVMAKYYDVLTVDCTGSGRTYTRLHKHFDCTADLEDGSENEFTLHVLGRLGFKLTDFIELIPPDAPAPDPGAAPPEIGPGNGYPVLCSDGTLSNSGGEPGACSWHGGVA